jgi:NAD(P)H-hydrate epimerase
VAIVGGAAGMEGAARLAGRAAFGAGAGLVHAVVPAASAPVIASAEPDLQTVAWDGGKVEGRLRDVLSRAGAVVIGPGLGRDPGARARVDSILAAAGAPVVLDADALIAFQGDVAGLRLAAAARPLILTPHLGEFRALFPEQGSTAEHDPWAAAAAAAEMSGAVVLLKGVPTVIATPKEGPRWTVAAGNPGLATGGSGDILSGLTGAFLARGIGPLPAAALAAQVLGRAADIGARRVTARALRPMDVLAGLPDLWRAWEIRRAMRPAPRAPVLAELERPRAV